MTTISEELARRKAVCDAATPLPDPGHSQACGCDVCSACWARGLEYQAAAPGIVGKAYPEALAALAECVDALTFIGQGGNAAPSAEALLDVYESHCSAALARVAELLGVKEKT